MGSEKYSKIGWRTMSRDEQKAYMRERQKAYRDRKRKETPKEKQGKPDVQKCRTCGKEKDYTEENFYRMPGAKWGLSKRCKPCQLEQQVANKRGISLEEYRTIKNKPCEICGDEGKIAVDHCHKTEKVRGGLCGRCNSGLGFFRDSQDLLEKAREYITRHEIFG